MIGVSSPRACYGELLHAGPSHDVIEAVISLVAGKLVDQVRIPFHRQLCGPGTDPDGRIGHCELIEQRIRVGPREPLDQGQILAGRQQWTADLVMFSIELNSLNNERFALPLAT